MSGELATALMDEQKLNVAGAGRLDFRHRCMRCLRPAMLSFSKLLRRRLKFTDQAQWIRSVIAEARVVYVAWLSPRFGSERLDGRAMSFFRADPGSDS